MRLAFLVKRKASMSQQHEFFLARAAQARSEADAASLPNVKDRCLRAVAAWEDMAARVERTEKQRARVEAARLARSEEATAAD
jgi:hypothetical protein